jgi:dTDP-4-amino-4,6-dideoxygalactose transaminase
MEEVMEIARKHGLFVIEDNAQGIGGDYIYADGSRKKTGTIGLIGTTSFFPSKNLGCYGDGGAIFTDDHALAIKLKMIANHGQQKRYYHDMVGCNSRLDTLQAAVLDIKLKKLDEYIEARRTVADYYDNVFGNHPNITIPFRAAYSRHVYHQYTLILENVNRDGLIEFLSGKGIPSMIYYPVPAHRQKMFSEFGGSSFELPVTDWLTERVISLPMHTELDEEQMNYISSHVLEFINRE